MADVKIAYAADAAFNISLNSLGSSTTSAKESDAVTNSSNYLDFLVTVTTKVLTGTISTYAAAIVFAYASIDDGSNYTGGASGSSATYTLTQPSNLAVLGEVAMPAQSATYRGGPWSVAAAFGGTMPERFGIVVLNACGITLDSTGNAARYQGVYQTVT